MIISETFYAVKCDKCGVIHDYDGTAFWSDENTAVDRADSSGWIKFNSGDYCPDCHSIGDDDTVTIRE